MNNISFNVKSKPAEPFEIIRSKNIDFARVIALNEKGQILTLLTEDGFTVPSACLDMDDRDGLDTLHRVAWEVACVTLGTLIYLNVIEATDDNGDKHNTLIVAARIARIDPMRARYARLFLKPEDFLRHYRIEIEAVKDTVKTAVKSIPELNPNYLKAVTKEVSFFKQVGAK